MPSCRAVAARSILRPGAAFTSFVHTLRSKTSAHIILFRGDVAVHRGPDLWTVRGLRVVMAARNNLRHMFYNDRSDDGSFHNTYERPQANRGEGGGRTEERRNKGTEGGTEGRMRAEAWIRASRLPGVEIGASAPPPPSRRRPTAYQPGPARPVWTNPRVGDGGGGGGGGGGQTPSGRPAFFQAAVPPRLWDSSMARHLPGLGPQPESGPPSGFRD